MAEAGRRRRRRRRCTLPRWTTASLFLFSIFFDLCADGAVDRCVSLALWLLTILANFSSCCRAVMN